MVAANGLIATLPATATFQKIKMPHAAMREVAHPVTFKLLHLAQAQYLACRGNMI
jgi:hypothetical protein